MTNPMNAALPAAANARPGTTHLAAGLRVVGAGVFEADPQQVFAE